MSKVAVVVSSRVPVKAWDMAITQGMETTKIDGLEEIAILGDGVPALPTYVNAPQRQNSGLILTPVITDWSNAQAVQTRNDALLKGATVVVILGFVHNSSAKHAIGRAMAEGITVAQVIEDKAEIVKSAELVRTAPGYEIELPAKLDAKQGATSPFAKFMGTRSTKHK